MEGRVSSAKKCFSDQLKEASKEASDAVGKYEKAVIEKMSSEALTIVFSMACIVLVPLQEPRR